ALPASRRLRPRGRAGRPHHNDGADGEPAAVPLLPAPSPLRAELPRPPSTAAVRIGAVHGLRRGDTGDDRRGDCGRERPGSGLPPRRDGRRRARRRADRGAAVVAVTETGTRACLPDERGHATSRDGLRLYWEIYGEGSTTIVLLPPS